MSNIEENASRKLPESDWERNVLQAIRDENNYLLVQDYFKSRKFTAKQKTDWFLDYGLRPKHSHAYSEFEEKLPDDYEFEEMLKRPNCVGLLYENLEKYKGNYTTEQKFKMIIAIITHKGVFSEGYSKDDFIIKLQSCGFNDKQKKEIVKSLRGDYLEIATDIAKYWKEEA